MGEESCSSRNRHALVPILPLKKWRNKGKGILSQAYDLTLALNTGMPNIYPRPPIRGLLEGGGCLKTGAQGRGGPNLSVAWEGVLQIYVSRDTGSGRAPPVSLEL